MVTATIRHRLEDREDLLSPCASRSRDSSRDHDEIPSPVRTEFQRDRDRIIHSKTFRRLKHKTQVFIAPLGDHYVTRLTHTLEVSQVARTIARALDLNEDLTEAMALGHDIGHTPFGHTGENELNRIHAGGFRHAEQSLRLVERLEKDGRGLNLTREVREGIVSHSKPRGDFLGHAVPDGLSLEGQVLRVADAVAYLNHDLADAFRAGLLQPEDLPDEVERTLGGRHSKRIDTMVRDIVESSRAASGRGAPGEVPVISMSDHVRQAVNVLREFMFQRVYDTDKRGEEGEAARRVVMTLYRHLKDNPRDIPSEFSDQPRAVIDHIAGMTDLYALRMAEGLAPGVSSGLRPVLP